MRKYSEDFEWIERATTKEKIVHCKDDEPKELETLIFDIHHLDDLDCLPNDWVYEQIYYAFCLFEENEGNNWEDLVCEVESDPYTRNLKEWAKEPFSDNFIDDVLTGGYEPQTNWDLLSIAQKNCKELIYREVMEFLKGQDE